MTTHALSRPYAGGHAEIAFGFSALLRRIHRRMTIRSDRKALMAMPDYMLADLGISRGEIESVTERGRGALPMDLR